MAVNKAKTKGSCRSRADTQTIVGRLFLQPTFKKLDVHLSGALYVIQHMFVIRFNWSTFCKTNITRFQENEPHLPSTHSDRLRNIRSFERNSSIQDDQFPSPITHSSSRQGSLSHSPSIIVVKCSRRCNYLCV